MLKRIIVFSLSALILVISCALPSLATGNHDTSDVDYYWGGYYEFEDGQFFQQYGITNYNSYNYDVALKSPNMVKEYASLTYEGSNMVGDYLDIYYQLNENYIQSVGDGYPSSILGTWRIDPTKAASTFSDIRQNGLGFTFTFVLNGSVTTVSSFTQSSGVLDMRTGSSNSSIVFSLYLNGFNQFPFVQMNRRGNCTFYEDSSHSYSISNIVLTITNIPSNMSSVSETAMYNDLCAISSNSAVITPYYPTPGYAQFYAVTESFSLPSEVLNDHLSQYYIYCDMSCVQAYIPGLQEVVDVICDVRIQGYDSSTHMFSDIEQLTYTANDAASGIVSYTDDDAHIAGNWSANNARDYICVANISDQIYDKYRIAWFCWAYLNVPWDDTGVTIIDPARSYNEKYYGRVRLEYVDPYVQVYKKKDVENAIANGTNTMIDQNNIIINQIGSPDPAIQNMFDAKIAENTAKIDSATSKQNAVFSQATTVVSQITAVNPAQMVSASFGDAYDSALGLWTGLSNVIFESDFVVFALSFVVTLATIYFIISAKVK